jgi:hypothetical protein
MRNALLLVAAANLCACMGTAELPPGNDACTGCLDSGSGAPDSGVVAPDGGGSGHDAGTHPDAGCSCDAGSPPDSGSLHDAGSPPDAGSFDAGPATGPLKASTVNPHYFVDPSGKAVLLTGSQTWISFQDLSQNATPAPMDFNAYVAFLKAHGHTATILWRKELPTWCGWGAGGTWYLNENPWTRTGPGTASDGLPKFDLTKLDQAYFDRLRARAVQLGQNGIYAIIMLFDGLGISGNRCGVSAPNGDGFPLTGVNNINGVDDGYGGGSSGPGSMTMNASNAITAIQDAYVQKAIDTLNDLPNVLWEISEEAPDNSTWWQAHMISLIHTYESGKPFQHPVGYPSLNVTGASDSTLYDSNADWVAPKARVSPTSSCGSGTPACKVDLNDSDHSYYGLWNDSHQTNRNYIWENFTNGNQVLLMDPYVIYWSGRNQCANAVGGVCPAPDTSLDPFRDNLGYTARYARRMNLIAMTPQPGLASTGYCLANATAGGEYLVYAPSGGGFSVDLTGTPGTVNVEWFDPSSGTTSSGGTVNGGATVSFTPPFGGDAVLYLH